jgi:hypothetical protein
MPINPSNKPTDTSFSASDVGAWSNTIKSTVATMQTRIAELEIKVNEFAIKSDKMVVSSPIKEVITDPTKERIYRELDKAKEQVLHCAKKLDEATHREQRVLTRGSSPITASILGYHAVVNGNASYWLKKLCKAEKHVETWKNIVDQIK